MTYDEQPSNSARILPVKRPVLIIQDKINKKITNN